MSIRILAPVLPVVTLVLAACGGGEGAPSFHSIGTGGTGGIYYPLGGALASRLSAADSTRSFTAEVTGGSVENVNRVMAGQIDLGFTLAVSAYEAYHAGIDGGAPMEELRIVAPLYPNVVHVLAREGAGIDGVGDLAGRRVSVGSPGSGTEQTARQILAAHGLTYDDVETRFLTFRESAAALRDGAIDAAILSVGYPAAAVLEATSTGGARLLGVGPEAMERLTSRHPYYGPGTIPVAAYPGVEVDVPTPAVMNWVVAREDLDDDVVTRILDLLRDHRAELIRVHDMARQIDLEALTRAPIPLHPAAEAWLADAPR